MANYNNIFAGIMAFITASSIAYAFWTPVNDWTATFPTELYIVVQTFWVSLLFASIVYFPFVMLISDDRGTA